jgi:hypothetical protein
LLPACDLAHSHRLHFVYNRDVVSFRKFVSLCMALLVLSAPLIACALPGEEMSKAEQDCCLQMSDDCGSSQMSDAHTCCTKTADIDGNALKTTNKYVPVAPELVAQTVFCSAPAIAANIPPCQPVFLHDASSPPGSITVLRI